MRLNKLRILILVLVVSLAISLGYIIVDKSVEVKETRELNIFQNGSTYGYGLALTQLMQKVVTCQPVSVFLDNLSIEIIGTKCLERQ